MAEPKTVSNLDVDVSIRWAEDQKMLEETRPLVAESTGISQHLQKDVTLPAAVPALQLLFGTNLVRPTWAAFYAPRGFSDQKRRLFTSAIAPSLGSDEQCEEKIGKLTQMAGAGQEDEEEGSEKKTFLKLLTMLVQLNKNLLFAISRLNQYKKG